MGPLDMNANPDPIMHIVQRREVGSSYYHCLQASFLSAGFLTVRKDQHANNVSNTTGPVHGLRS